MSSTGYISSHFSEEQFEILLHLYKSSFSNFKSLSKLWEQILASAAQGLKVNRVSIWKFEDDLLICNLLYNHDKQDFLPQFDLNKQQFPNYFEALQKGIVIAIEKAQYDPITKDLLDFYLQPLNIISMMDIPIREEGVLKGVLCCEMVGQGRAWSEKDISFARSIADILSLFTEEFKRRAIEEALLENQDRFQFISENISDGIYIVENDQMVFTSDTYLKMVGLSKDQKLNLHEKDMFSLVHKDDVDKTKEIIYSAIENHLSSVKYVFRCLKSDGSYMWREDIMNLHYDQDGKAFRAVTIARDITTEKNLEIENAQNSKFKEIQNELLLTLYAQHLDVKFSKKVDMVLELAVKGLRLERSSFWKFDQNHIVCKNVLNMSAKGLEKNVRLDIRDIPKYFDAINSKTAIVADDVYTHESTSELIDSYLKPLGITDMLDVPIRANGKFYGVLCCEHGDDPRIWADYDISFARALADYLSLALEEQKRKRVEDKLTENQQKLNFISQNTSDGIIIFENQEITYVSPAYAKLSGYSLEYIKKLTVEDIFELVHPDDVVFVRDLIYDNLEQRSSSFRYEYRILKPDGVYIWREDSVSVIYKTQEDEYSKYIIISRDISERKKIEEELNQKQQQLQMITENSSDGFVVLENRKITFISPSYCKFLGYDEREALGTTAEQILENIHPDDQPRIRKAIAVNLQERVTSFKFEFRFKDKLGKYHWREDSTNVLYNDQGLVLKYIIISRDIGERKQIEKQLIESEQQLRLITENSSDGVAVIEGGQISYVSPSFAKLLGYTSDFYKTFSLQDIFDSIHPEDADRVITTIYNALDKKEAEIKYEHRFKGFDGTYHWREDSANVIYNDDGSYSKYIIITRDISARKEAEKEKNRLYKITEKQNEKLINFTHIVSHDIRSHTSNLTMILDLFEETEDKEEQQQYFDMLKQSTNKLSDTIFYLNETVAVQSGIKTENVPLLLRKEIEKTIIGINAIIKTNKAQIHILVAEDIEIMGTQSYLESIIFNLLTNAIKYKSPLRTPEITIKAERIADEVKLSFVDNGIGIDLEKNKDKIFGMYKTFAGNSDAVGLGLFMVKNHIESMGGRIEVESVLHEGTTFNLYFI